MKKYKQIMSLLFMATFTFSLASCTSSKSSAKNCDLNISAAASLKEAMAEIQEDFKAENPNINLTFNYGSSGSLQKQIEQGAPCDIFISAGKSQMDSLKDEDLLENDTNKNLLKNSLVLISNSKDIDGIDDLSSSKVTHIAIGEPSSVPAGKYASETLTSLKLLDKLNDKIVYAKDVKEVLSWVATGNAEAGFVYKSDTYNVDSINIIEEMSEKYHSPIIYPVSLIKASENKDEAKIFEDFLSTDKVKSIFEKYGYEPQ